MWTSESQFIKRNLRHQPQHNFRGDGGINYEPSTFDNSYFNAGDRMHTSHHQ